MNDTKCIEQVKQTMEESTPGFDIVYDRGAYVLDVDVNDGVCVNDERRKFESDSGISFLVIRKEYWERALSQAQQDHERQQGIQQDVHGENQHTFEQVKVIRTHEKGTSVSWRHTLVLSVPGVRSASRPRTLTENTPERVDRTIM